MASIGPLSGLNAPARIQQVTRPGNDQRPLLVVALGGNALLPADGPLTMAVQRQQAASAAEVLAPLFADWRVVLTHGSGPQVGILSELASRAHSLKDLTLDAVDAETAGLLGYVLIQAFAHLDDVITVLTQVVVDKDDPAFLHPTKPIGRTVDEPTAELLEELHGWTFVQQPSGPGRGKFRRVVASPLPQAIVEIGAIRTLVDAGVVPICAGGGGIPVIADRGGWKGIEAVVDKDLVSSLLACELHADALLLLTDVEGLMTGWGTPDCHVVNKIGANEAAVLAASLEAGSMEPKVSVCASFTLATGNASYIGRLADAAAVLACRSGTQIQPD